MNFRILLKSHKKTHQNLEKCKHCHRFFPGITSLKKHETNVHSGIKKFECKICLRRFARKDTLRIHMVTHTGEKNFDCKICGKKFGHKSSVQRHIKNIHKDRLSNIFS